MPSGGKRLGAGRKPKNSFKVRSKTMMIRMTQDEFVFLSQAAKKSGLGVSTYIRHYAIEQAEKDLKKRMLKG